MKTFTVTVCAVFLLVSGLIIWAGIVEGKRWAEFKAQHHCHVVAKIDGSVFPVFGTSANGSMVMSVGSTDEKTGWLCNDGITYYK